MPEKTLLGQLDGQPEEKETLLGGLNLNASYAGFPQEINPGDLQRLTNGAASIDPAGDFKTGVRQAAGGIREKAEEIQRYAPIRMKIIRDIKMAPMLTPRDLEKEYLDELNKKQLIS